VLGELYLDKISDGSFNLTKHKSFYKHKQVWIAHSMFKTYIHHSMLIKAQYITFQLVYLLLWVGTWLVPLIPMITGNKTTGLELVRNEMHNLTIQCSWHIYISHGYALMRCLHSLHHVLYLLTSSGLRRSCTGLTENCFESPSIFSFTLAVMLPAFFTGIVQLAVLPRELFKVKTCNK